MAKTNLNTWFMKRLESLRKQSADQPPFLPSPRPRPLTPSTSDDFISQPPTCLFFSKLPAETRRAILLMAFGEHTLHIDIVFDYPLLPPPPAGTQKFPNHAGIYTQDDKAPVRRKSWRWGGAVCHRNSPTQRQDSFSLRFRLGPWADNCMRGDGQACSLWEGVWPDKCRVGIMGFLCSCRQAYAEGTDILYGSNCISITSEPLMLHLPQLLLPQRLASITSMELLINGYGSKQQYNDGYVDLARLPPILHHLTTHCQSLKSLLLSLNISDWANAKDFIDGPTLPIIDTFYLSMELREMLVEVPELIYNAWREHVTVVPHHPLEPPKESPSPGSNPWRCLDGNHEKAHPKAEMQWRTLANYPRSPLQLPTPENAGRCVPSRGYWIKDGKHDPTPPRFFSCGIP